MEREAKLVADRAHSFSFPDSTINKDKKMQSYTTSDFYLTAFLVASGVTLDSYDRRSGKTIFRFAQNNGLDQLVREYYADHAAVSPVRYGNSLRNLKALIYSANTNTYEKSYYHKSGATR